MNAKQLRQLMPKDAQDVTAARELVSLGAKTLAPVASEMLGHLKDHKSPVIRFNTSAFDVSKERPNPINPIPGESLLLWLRERARPEVEVSEPAAEDWGWYSDLKWEGRNYMLGSSASEDVNGQWEWILQIETYRSLAEKLLGRAKMGEVDACANFFQQVVKSEPTFEGVSVDPEP